MTTPAELQVKIEQGNDDLGVLFSAINDPAGTVTVDDGTIVDNLRKRLDYSETTATASAAAALVSEGNAGTSETNAAASAADALVSEGNADTSETNAAASAAAALVSEGNADTSETNAAASAAAALVSENAAAASAAAADQVMIKIETQLLVGDVTEVDFALPSGYTKHILELVNVRTSHAVAGQELRAQMSDDGALTFDTGNSYYSEAKPYTSTATPANVPSMQIARSRAVSGTQYYDGSVQIMSASNASKTRISADISSTPAGSALFAEEYIGTHNVFTAQNAIRITLDGTDLIKAGSTLILYGIK